MEGQRGPAPEGAAQFRARPIDARGNYGGITITTAEDAINAGVHIGYTAVEQTWGPEAAEQMRAADAKRIRTRIESGMLPNGQSRSEVIFSSERTR